MNVHAPSGLRATQRLTRKIHCLSPAICVVFCFMIAVSVQAFAQTTPQNDKPAQQPKGSPAQPTHADDPKTKAKTTTPPEAPDPSQQDGGIEILSDTQGVDFHPYLRRLHATIQSRWEAIIPEVALAPVKKAGTVVIRIAILKDGTIANLRTEQSSGDESMDKAVWNAVSSGPLPQLPRHFGGDNLLLRCQFFYNPPRKTPPERTNDKK